MSQLDLIQEFEDVIDDEQLSQIVQHSYDKRWGFGLSSPSSQNKFLSMNLSKKFYTDEIFNSIKSLIGQNFKIDRVYLNGQFYGMPGSPHCDSPQTNKFTFLLYVNPVWDFLWGGQTIFFDRYVDEKTSDVVINSPHVRSFFPKPKSALFFPSNIIHYAECPTKFCQEMRLTLAYKLERID